MITADQITPDYGFQCGPTFDTNVVSLANGREVRNVNWSRARHKARADFTSLTSTQFLYLKDLFQQCRGQAYAFLFRDWTDYRATDEAFGTGDATTKAFQLSKTSKLSGGSPYTRIVSAPEAGVTVKVNGSVAVASVSMADGSVTFTTAPAAGASLTWTGKFLVVMRFASDDLQASVQPYFDADGYTIISGSVDLIESFEDAG